MDFAATAKKWQGNWEKAKLFEAKPSKRKKYFITFPYPYVNAAPHIGHSFSALRADAMARFRRMQGFNVLFPQAFHATGEPIVGLVKRLAAGDASVEETLRQSGAESSDLEAFKNDPVALAKFFAKRWEEDFRSAGLSIDWTRKFITTQITPAYSRFVEWQYNTLRKKGYITQGTHPVVWCPKDKSPTGDHDRLQGEGESPVEYVLLKFRFEDAYLPAATLRPETIYGVTNLWVNPDAEYVKVRVDGENWIVSRRAAEKLADQSKDFSLVKSVDTQALFTKRATAPVTNRYVPVLPARFVDADAATGIVMSVPSHAPYDWVALKEMMSEGALERYGVLVNEMQPVPLIKSELGEHPAIEIAKQMNITSTGQRDALDKATSIVYKKEFHSGILNEKCGPYAGMRVSEAKDRIKIDFIEKGAAGIMYDVAGVVCRCGTACHVKVLENQWFLKYSDAAWKRKVRKALASMTILPEEARNNFENTIAWLNDKACARRSGLGTPLPWDSEWIVETLSDSTIYMAYYTIARTLGEEKIKAEQLSDEVFDYIFFGRGDAPKLAAKSGIKKVALAAMRREFEYFYPVDMRNSGKDLLQNHLTFYIFHHVAMWPKGMWPRGISVNGFVNVEGEKMSKSRGNMLPVRMLLEAYGPDLVRINILASAEGMDDPDWRAETIKSYRARIEALEEFVKGASTAKGRGAGSAEKHLQSVMQSIIREATESFASLRFRSAANAALFEAVSELRWYLKRAGGMERANRAVLRSTLSAVIRLIAPLVPHACEELWNALGNKNFVSVAEWPGHDKNLVDREAETAEIFLKNVLSDMEEVKKLAKISPKKATIFYADDWKFLVYGKVLGDKEKGADDMVKEIMKSDLRRYGKATLDFIQTLYRKRAELGAVPGRQKQAALLSAARSFIASEARLEIAIEDASRSEHPKAKAAMPHKPGILLE